MTHSDVIEEVGADVVVAPAGNGEGALAGLTVLELSVARAGPVAGRQLADWGATVIKVEMPANLAAADPFQSTAFRHGSDFQNLHRNRRSLTIDLKNQKGLAALRRIAANVDVLIENFRPDVKKRLGFDYERLSAANPRLVYASISGFGQDGPYALRPGVDQIAQGMAGLMSITGEAGGPPLRTGIAVSDVCAGLFCAFGIVTALLERERSGRGQWVRTSLLESLIFLSDFQAARWLREGEVPRACGNDHPTIQPGGLFRASDSWINIGALPDMWGKFCAVLDRADMEAREDYSTPSARLANKEQLHAEIEETTERFPASFWIDRFNAAGVPCGPVYSMDQVFADPQVKHLDLTIDVPHVSSGSNRQVRQPITMSRTRQTINGGAPERGEHSAEVLAELGFTGDEIDALLRSSAI